MAKKAPNKPAGGFSNRKPPVPPKSQSRAPQASFAEVEARARQFIGQSTDGSQ